MAIDIYRSTHETRTDRIEKTHGTTRKRILLGMLLLGVVLAVVSYEVKTSKLQSKTISSYAASLRYSVKPGPSDTIVYPQNGPFDKRLGYARLPQLLDRLRTRGMEIDYQTRFSPSLARYTSFGYFPPYREKTQVGLHIIDCQGKPVYQSLYPRRVYTSFSAIPPRIIQSLLFIENRNMLDTTRPNLNPAVDWLRLSKAVMHETAKTIGFEYPTMGASTLATQLEKYRHSPGGITSDPGEKLRQMISASVRTYQRGSNTIATRQEVVLNYINSVPLSAAPGYGEVHGLGDGLWVWFEADFEHLNQLLHLPEGKGKTLQEQALALRQVISLLIAQRRPSYYLAPQGRAELHELTNSYLRLMTNNGYISPQLRDASLNQQVAFRQFGQGPLEKLEDTDKGIVMVRTQLSAMLGVPLYDLDRLDMTATTTLQNDLQRQVSAYLNNLRDPVFADTIGLFGERLLNPEEADQVRYSFTLYESTPQGNLLRVQTDNTFQPLDINEGTKLELGSTAKLRVFVHYLEVIAEIHQRYVDQPRDTLVQALGKAEDNLSRWVLEYLISQQDKSLPATLQAAMERRYSASPYEVFFTGGGVHTFHNFREEDDNTRPTIREALLKSINLPFIRLMRDLVRYSIYQTAGSTAELLGNNSHPGRRQYLTRFADREGQMYLLDFWHKYKGKSPEERWQLLLKTMRINEVRLAAVHRYLYPETDSVSFSKFLLERLPDQKLTHKRIMELYHRYGPDAYNLPDQGYIARVHPLELWLLDYMRKHPNTTWTEVVEASKEERQEVYTWLFRTRYKNARDSRIRIMLEIDAFDDIHKRWKKYGYPFDRLVPSYATALGSSGDKPAALADLMGIIINNGVQQQKIRIPNLHFAANTPYETALSLRPVEGKQVMHPEVATAVKEALSAVVDLGTARRLQGGFTKPDGTPLAMGGKTGTGDNRLVAVTAGGYRKGSRVLNRTATFVFFLGDRHFGTLTAFVPGSLAGSFSFTSALPVQVLKGMAPILQPYLEPGTGTLCQSKSSPQLMQAGLKEVKRQPKVFKN